MAKLTADFLLERLVANGVRRIYGYPGDGINAIVGALDRHQEELEFVQVRHEEMAAFMACAHAKWTGEVGVCLATSGPGAIHLLNGHYDAKLDHQPVLAIVGQQSRMGLGGSYQQEVDLASLFKDVASEYVQMAYEATQIRHLIDRAHRIALDQRTVTALIIPNDLAEEPAKEQPPRELGATDEVIETAETLGAGVAKALLGRTVVPDGLPFVTGSIGLLGTKPSWTLMNECDTLLMVGSSFPYSEWLPKPGQARGVQIDLKGTMLNIRYPMELGLVGDAKETLKALSPLLDQKDDRSWREQLEEEIQEWWRLVEERAMQDADPINPQRVFWELNKYLPDGAIVTADSGSGTNWWARELKLRRGMRAALSGTLATMGPAMPYAVAAKFTHPDRPVVAVVGDGAMQMNGISALIDAARHYPRWSDP